MTDQNPDYEPLSAVEIRVLHSAKQRWDPVVAIRRGKPTLPALVERIIADRTYAAKRAEFMRLEREYHFQGCPEGCVRHLRDSAPEQRNRDGATDV